MIMSTVVSNLLQQTVFSTDSNFTGNLHVGHTKVVRTCVPRVGNNTLHRIAVTHVQRV